MRLITKWLSLMLCALMLFGQATLATAESVVDQTPTEGEIAALEPMDPDDAVPDPDEGIILEAPDGVYITDLMLAGREIRYDASMSWHRLPMLEDQVNDMLVSLFDSITLEGRYAQSDYSNAYQSFLLRISGQEALPLDTVTKDGVSYIRSPLYGTKVMSLAYKDIKPFMETVGVYLDKLMAEQSADMPADSFSDMFAQIAAQIPDDPEEAYGAYYSYGDDDEQLEAMQQETVDALYAQYGLGELPEKLTAWVDSMEGIPYTDTLNSVYDVEYDSVTLYQTDKAKIIELFEIILGGMKDNEAFWNMAVSQNPAMLYSNGDAVSMEEILTSYDEMYDEIMRSMDMLGEDTVVNVYECADAAGNEVMTQVEILIVGPESEIAAAGTTEADVQSATPASEINGYLAWLADSANIYMEMIVDDTDGMIFSVEPNPQLPNGLKDDGFIAAFSLVEDGEESMQLMMQYSSIATGLNGNRVWDGSLTFIASDMREAYGVQLVMNEVDAFIGEDVEKQVTCDLYLIMNAETYPVMSVQANVSTGEMQDPPFDVEDPTLEVSDLGAMTEAEIGQWIESDIMVGSMQTVMKIVGLLPPEVLQSMMGTSATEATIPETIEQAAPEAEEDAEAEAPATYEEAVDTAEGETAAEAVDSTQEATEDAAAEQGK